MGSRSVYWLTLSTPSPAREASVHELIPTCDCPRSSGHTHRRRDCTLSSLFAAYAASCSSSDQQTAGRSDYLSWLGLASQCSRQLRIVASISCRTDDIRQRRSGPISSSRSARRSAMYQALARYHALASILGQRASQSHPLTSARGPKRSVGLMAPIPWGWLGPRPWA
jgi:hypothetical protein